jgi:hypothetical protein
MVRRFDFTKDSFEEPRGAVDPDQHRPQKHRTLVHQSIHRYDEYLNVSFRRSGRTWHNPGTQLTEIRTTRSQPKVAHDVPNGGYSQPLLNQHVHFLENQSHDGAEG